MGIFKLRKQPLAIRKFNDLFHCANKTCQERLQRLIANDTRCSCPLCKSSENVIKNGSKNGIPKFKCTKHENTVHFLTTTSYEAFEFYREIMIEYLSQLACFSAQINRGVLFNEMSQYFAEFALEAFYEHIQSQSNKIQIKEFSRSELITVYFDISGCGILKNKAIIMAKINGEIIFNIEVASNYLTTHKFLATIKKKWGISDDRKLMIISDGERCFVDTVRELFPNCIHVRQFHKESSKGIVYIHLRYYSKLYTIRILWDAVLNESEPSKQVKKMRKYRAKMALESPEKKKRYSELSKDVMVWQGTVYQPRGYRKRIDGKKKERPKQKARQSPFITTRGDAPKVIFCGPIEEAKKIKVVQCCFSYLKKEFSGRYITSNAIETMFNVKSKLYNHRTMKFGNRILVCILYSEFVLKNKSKMQLQKYFRNQVITYELLQQKVLYGTGSQKRENKQGIIITILNKINKAISGGYKMVLHYCDRLKRHTSRMIIPKRVTKNEFNGLYTLHAYCEKRKEDRTFLLQRIKDIDIFDPAPFHIPSPSYG